MGDEAFKGRLAGSVVVQLYTTIKTNVLKCKAHLKKEFKGSCVI